MGKAILTKDGGGKVNKNILPPEFTQLEYIDSSYGSNVAIRLGVTPSPTIGVEVEVSFTSITTSEDIIFGSSAGSAYANGNVYTFERSSNTLKTIVGTSSITVADSNAIVVGNKYLLSFNKDVDKKFFINGTLIGTASSTIPTDSYEFAIFHRTVSTSPETGFYTPIKVYRLRLYNNGNIIKDFYPCICNTPVNAYNGTATTSASWTCGLYDLIDNNFHINYNTSGQVKGGNVYEGLLW